MCDPQSRFVLWGQAFPQHLAATTTEAKQQTTKISWHQQAAQDDAVRLSCSTLHEHQHGPARKEALPRRQAGIFPQFSNNDDAGSLQNHSIGQFDCECSHAKFLVTSLCVIKLDQLGQAVTCDRLHHNLPKSTESLWCTTLQMEIGKLH